MRVKKVVAGVAMALAGHSAMASGIPTVDLAAITQFILGYVEQLAQGVQQATSYALQVKQFENEVLRYKELIAARQLPGSYLYDSVANLRNETMKTLSLGSALVGTVSNPESYAKELLAAYDPTKNTCLKSGTCNTSQLQSELETARSNYFYNQSAEIAQDVRNAQQLDNYNRQTQNALMSQIRGAKSQVQSEQAAAQASAAAAQATNTQTQVMMQIAHKQQVRELQERQMEELAQAQAKQQIYISKKAYTSDPISNSLFLSSARSVSSNTFF